MTKLKIGDGVKLRSGGPKMTVIALGAPSAKYPTDAIMVGYFSDSVGTEGFSQVCIHPDALVRIDPVNGRVLRTDELRTDDGDEDAGETS